MWPISTWTCFWLWLLLKLSLIGTVSSLLCYQCLDYNEDKCGEDYRPFNRIPCKDPALCLIVLAKYAPGVGDKVMFRGCAHPDFITALGGVHDSCVTQNDDITIVNMASNWVKGHPNKNAGGIQHFLLHSGLDGHEICSCNGTKCNDVMGEVGKPYPEPVTTTDNNGNPCACDNNENQCEEDKKDKDGNGGGSGAGLGHHSLSIFVLGGGSGLIILSVLRAVMDGF